MKTSSYHADMNNAHHAFQRLYEIIVRLRAPDGCPWDKEQTPVSLRGSLIEEAYETVEAIDEGNVPHVEEELGDVFMLATMVAYMYEQEGAFSVADSLNKLCDKLIRRHPHVFGEANAGTPDEVVRQWNDIKEKVEGRGKKDGILDSVSRAMPPLERSYKLQKKASKAGFDWIDAGQVWDKIAEELAETREAWEDLTRMPVASTDSASETRQTKLEEELGDLLFSVVNVSRFLGVDPSLALHRANTKFERRFRHVEGRMKDTGMVMNAEHFSEMDLFWNEAKRTES